MKTTTLAMFLLLIGCASSDAPSQEDAAQSSTHAEVARRGGDLPPSAVDRDTILATLSGDTVWIESNGERALVWTTRFAGERYERYRSGNLYDGSPEVRLEDITGDGVPDLFITFQFEEMTSGILLKGTAQGSSLQVFSTAGAVTCRVPELRDVNGDGKLDIVSYVAGAFDPAMCRSEGRYELCKDAYPMTWPEVHIQQTGGVFEQSTRGLTDFYKEWQNRYKDALHRLEREPVDGPCGSELLEPLERSAERAASLAV